MLNKPQQNPRVIHPFQIYAILVLMYQLGQSKLRKQRKKIKGQYILLLEYRKTKKIV